MIEQIHAIASAVLRLGMSRQLEMHMDVGVLGTAVNVQDRLIHAIQCLAILGTQLGHDFLLINLYGIVKHRLQQCLSFGRVITCHDCNTPRFRNGKYLLNVFHCVIVSFAQGLSVVAKESRVSLVAPLVRGVVQFLFHGQAMAVKFHGNWLARDREPECLGLPVGDACVQGLVFLIGKNELIGCAMSRLDGKIAVAWVAVVMTELSICIGNTGYQCRIGFQVQGPVESP